MKVTMHKRFVLLGTEAVLNEGETYEATPATNQPDYEIRKLFFVTDPKTGIDVLCQLTYDFVIAREVWKELRYEISLQRLSEEEGGGWMAWIPLLGKGLFMSDGETAAEALENLENLRIEMYDTLFLAVKEHYRKIPMPEGQFQCLN